jgi:MFS family permease
MAMTLPLRTTRAPLAAMAGIGVLWGALAAMYPAIKARLAVDDGQFGLILLAAAIGALCAMALAPRLHAAIPRWSLTFSGLAVGLAAMPLGLAEGVMAFTVIMVAIGITTGFYDIIANARVSELEARHDLALMNLNHSAFSFAYALSALLTGVAREASVAPGAVFMAVGLAVTGLAAVTYTARVPVGALPEAQQASSGAIGTYVWLAGFVTLIGFFVENATEGWSALHIERTLNGGAAEGALGPAMLGLTMGIGRFMGHLVTVRGSEPRVLFWAAWLAATGLAIAAVAPGPLVAYVGFGLLGLGVSVIAPLTLALAGQTADPGRRTLAVSRVAMIGYFGFFIGPPLMGFVSQGFGLRIAFAMAALFLILIPLVLLPRMARSAPIWTAQRGRAA